MENQDMFQLIFGEFVLHEYGAQTWAVVKSRAHDLVQSAFKRSSYSSGSSSATDVQMHANLMQITCQQTQLPVAVVARAYGLFFIEAAVKKGFTSVIRGVGRDVVQFLSNVNTFVVELHLSMDMPKAMKPEFQVEKVTETSLELHYWSTRAGLSSWVEGICEAVASKVYNTQIQFRLLQGREDGSCDHEVWEVTYPPVAIHNDCSSSRIMDASPSYRPEAELFGTLFPFHVVMDANLVAKQVGFALGALVPDLVIGAHVNDHLKMNVPWTGWDFKTRPITIGVRNGCVLLETKAGIELKGAFYPTRLSDGTPALLFVGTPRVYTLNELEACGMNISDIPPHDVTSDFVVLAERRRVDTEIAKRLEEERLDLLETAKKLEAQRLESELANRRLKESLAQALSTERLSGIMGSKFKYNTPAEQTIKILDKLLMGETIDSEEAISLRDNILSAGKDFHKPGKRTMSKLRNMNKDEDVSRSLMTLLSIDEGAEEEPSQSAFASVISMSKASSWGDEEEDLAINSFSMFGASYEEAGELASGSFLSSMMKNKRNLSLSPDSARFHTARSDTDLLILEEPSDKVLAVLAKMDDWQFDTFELDEVTSGRPLSTLAFAIIRNCSFVPNIEEHHVRERLASFLRKIEDGYPNNPYHCRIHAADVVRTLYVILTRGGVIKSLWHEACDMDLLVAILAAVIHDFEHRGVNNDYLIKTGDELSVRYNDRSPMENHHLAAAFQVLKQDSNDFLKDLQPKARALARRQVIDMVLATDMKQHFSQVSMFNTKFAAIIDSKQKGMYVEMPTDEDTRSMVLQMCLKCADLGHLTSSEKVHRRWVQRLEEEFFLQGDREVAASLPISPLMDRTKEGVTKSQPGFFSIVVLPQFQSFCEVFPGCEQLLEALQANNMMWLNEG